MSQKQRPQQSLGQKAHSFIAKTQLIGMASNDDVFHKNIKFTLPAEMSNLVCKN